MEIVKKKFHSQNIFRVSPNPYSFHRCDVCDFQYQMQEATSQHKEWIPSWCKFFTLVGFDIGIVLGTWQLLVFGITIATILIDFKKERYDLPIMKELAAINGFFADYLWGNAWFFFILGTISIIFGAVALIVKFCGGECCDTSKNVSMSTYHYHYHSYSSLDWFFFWYVWSFSPIPRGGYYGSPVCLCPLDGDPLCFLSACSGGGGSGISGCIPSGGSDCKDAGAILLVIAVVVFLAIMLVGIIAGAIIFGIYFAAVIQKRLHILEKKTEMSKQIIADLNSSK
jgi:hypothetical protein